MNCILWSQYPYTCTGFLSDMVCMTLISLKTVGLIKYLDILGIYILKHKSFATAYIYSEKQLKDIKILFTI